MVWFVGFMGFVMGFAMGQLLLMHLLRNVSDEELKTNKDLQRRYGLLNWGISILGAWAAVYVYNHWDEMGLNDFFETVMPV